MVHLRLIVICALFLLAPGSASSQCTEPHYRWSEKTDDSLASTIPVRTSIADMLNRWAVPGFTSEAKYKCADRAGRELRVYSLLGWVRRVKTGESDGDWHLELTARQDSPVDSCIVVEIPPPDLSGNYAVARQDLQAMANWGSNGDVSPPVRLRIIGAAFFDGEHRGGPTRRDRTDGAHGRCNASARALWELHPVYWVKQP
jgi:hypothetical protein